jgi:hypothetical protein
MDSVMGMHKQQLKRRGTSFPTIANQAEQGKWYSAAYISNSETQHHSTQIPRRIMYDNKFMANKGYYRGTNAVQKQAFSFNVPIQCTHLECRYDKLYIRNICTHTTAANMCKLSNLRFM